MFDDILEEIGFLLSAYTEKFGNTFSMYDVKRGQSEKTLNLLVEEMKKAIQGERGAIANEELGIGIGVPDDANT